MSGSVFTRLFSRELQKEKKGFHLSQEPKVLVPSGADEIATDSIALLFDSNC